MQNRKAKRRNVPDGFNTIIDEDGVVLSVVPLHKQIPIKEKARYVSMYLSDEHLYVALKGLGNFGAVWGFVMNNFNSENAMFYFSKTIREDVCKVTGLSDGTVRSAINSFCESNMLLKIRNAEYMVNPTYFYKGTWDNRPLMIEKYEEKKSAKEILEQNKRVDAKTV